jgi:ferredoxin, 2Fe-2S
MCANIVTIHVTDQVGDHSILEGLEGWRLMEVMRDYGLPIKAECGGACSCATCHVYVDAEWIAALPVPKEEEIERLDDAFNVNGTSRLSCQIILDGTLDGLTVTLAAGTEP